jgi:hypothetical protein
MGYIYEGGPSMPNFVTFDDGLNYVAIADIESFGYQHDGDFKGGTWVKLRNGHTVRVQWEVSEEKLGPIANLHY